MYCLTVGNFDFTRKIEQIEFSIFEEKIRQNETVLYCLAIDNFDLTRKIEENSFFNFLKKNSSKYIPSYLGTYGVRILGKVL